MRRRFAVAGVVMTMIMTTVGVGAMVPGAVAGAAGSTAPIVVGGDGDLALNGGVAQGFVAGIYRFNKAGGLDGRKIEFKGFLDDGFSAQSNLTNAQQLVENDHVMAVVPFSSEIATGSTSTFLAQSKVPFIGYATSAAFTNEPAWGFGIDGNQSNPEVQGLNGWYALVNVVTGHQNDPGKVKVAFIGENVPGVTTSIQALAAVATHVGMHVVYAKAPMAAIGTTNYGPYAQDVMSSGANLVFEVLGTSDSTGLAAALKAAGYQGKIVNGVTYYPGQLASQPNEAAALDGVYVDSQFPVDENNTPAVKQAEADLKATGQPPYLTTGVSVGYWSAIVFEQMLKATLQAEGGDAAKVTGATLEKTVNSGFTYTDPLAGGIGDEYFPAEETITTGCITLVKTVGTHYQQITPLQCSVFDAKLGKQLDIKTGKPIS